MNKFKVGDEVLASVKGSLRWAVVNEIEDGIYYVIDQDGEEHACREHQLDKLGS